MIMHEQSQTDQDFVVVMPEDLDIIGSTLKDDPPHPETLTVKEYCPHLSKPPSLDTAQHHSDLSSTELLHDQVSQILASYNQIIINHKWQKGLYSSSQADSIGSE